MNPNLKRLRNYFDKLAALETKGADYERPLLINEKYNSWFGPIAKKTESKFNLIKYLIP